mgnify:CR=1 FL=1
MKKYIQLYNALRDQITRGVLPPGGRLPTENALAADYGLSRQTVRQALQFITVSSADRVLEAALLPAGDPAEAISVPAAPALPIPAPKTRRKPGIRQ